MGQIINWRSQITLIWHPLRFSLMKILGEGGFKMKAIKILFVVSLFLFTGFNQKLSFAQSELSATDIIAKSRLAFYYAGDDTRAKVLMELINKDGQKRIRELTM